MGYFPESTVDLAQVGAAVLLEEVEVASATPTITFDNIPPGYGALWIMGKLGGPLNAEMGLGSGAVDTGPNYRYMSNLDGDSEGTVEANAGTIATSVFGLAVIADGGAAYFSGVDLMLPGYAKTGVSRSWLARAGGMRTSTLERVGLGGGLWLNTTDPIDIITIGNISGSAGGNIIAGSYLQLYGVGGPPLS